MWIRRKQLLMHHHHFTSSLLLRIWQQQRMWLWLLIPILAEGGTGPVPLFSVDILFTVTPRKPRTICYRICRNFVAHARGCAWSSYFVGLPDNTHEGSYASIPSPVYYLASVNSNSYIGMFPCFFLTASVIGFPDSLIRS